MQQRLAIGHAPATDPALVVMDEPAGNLDEANSRAVLNLIQNRRARLGTTFVIAIHDPASQRCGSAPKCRTLARHMGISRT